MVRRSPEIDFLLCRIIAFFLASLEISNAGQLNGVGVYDCSYLCAECGKIESNSSMLAESDQTLNLGGFGLLLTKRGDQAETETGRKVLVLQSQPR